MTAPLTTYRVVRTTSPRNAHQQPAHLPLHTGDIFTGHAMVDAPRWVVWIKAGQLDCYVKRVAVEVVNEREVSG